MAKEKLFQVGIKALIENKEGKVLVLKVEASKYNNNTEHWDIPGGRIQEGDDAMKTLRKEIEEETGVKEVTDPKFFAAVIAKHEYPNETGHIVGLVLMIYKVTIPENSKIVLNFEHPAYEWVDKAEAGKRMASKYPKEFTDLL